MSRNTLLFAALLSSTLLAACETPTGSLSPSGSVNGLGSPVPSLAPMLKQVAPAVVNISSEGRLAAHSNPLLNDPFFRRFFNESAQAELRTESLGSGVVIDAKQGFIVTNYHVVEQATAIMITLHDGRRFKASLVGADPGTDLAVIRIPARNLSALKLADSDRLQVGDFAVAIGNPFGLGQTVTSGIVSALGRSGLGIEGYEDFIQTDASINPGNSGGALVNLRGELIGINTAILAPGSGGNIGINFAIPTNMVKRTIDQLLQYGQVLRGQLGVSVADTQSGVINQDGQASPGAMIINVAANSAAARAGLRVGDVVITVNERPVGSADALRNSIGLLPLNEQVRLEIVREGQTLQLAARLDQR